MTINELIQIKEKTFSKTDMVIAESVRRFTNAFAYQQISDILKICPVSQSAITRFAKKLGFSGFQEFQYALQNDLKTGEKEEKELTSAEIYGGYIKTVEDYLSEEKIAMLAEKLRNARNVYLLGESTSSYPAQYLRFIMRLNGKNTYLLTQAEFFEFRSLLDKEDVLIDFSSSHATAESIIKSIKENRKDRTPWLALITMSAKHPLRKYFDLVIDLPANRNAKEAGLIISEVYGYFMFLDKLSEALDIKDA